MKLKRIETPGIAHYAYLIADGGEAAIVDPRRDVDEYLSEAQALGVAIRYVIETHRQEDFVMGGAHLASRTGAKIVNGHHDLFGHGDLRLADGESIKLGSLTVEARHTPGHTPESVSYAVFTEEPESSTSAWGVFTGDTLFYGDTGRTDLTDENRAEENAGLLYDKVHERIGPLGDGALVLPAHGPGSVCGSNMASLPFSTLGTERRTNPVFTSNRDAFAKNKGGERLPRPPYFRHMERVNLEGGMAPKFRPEDIALIDLKSFANELGNSTCIDTRAPEGFAGGHIKDSYSVWMGGLGVFGGWVANNKSAVYLVCDRDADVATASQHLSRIGIDGVKAGLAGGFGTWRSSGRPTETSGIIFPKDLAESGDIQILDVREADEFARGHIPAAKHTYVGHLANELSELALDPKRPVAVTCGVGHRASVAVSILKRAGFADVRNLLGGMKAWSALGLRTEEGDDTTR